MQLIDSHAHIQSDLFGDEIRDIVERSKEAGIVAVMNIGTSLRESKECLELARKYPNFLFATVGLHPEDATADIVGKDIDELSAELKKLANDDQCKAIGECGLDYGKKDEVVNDEQKALQKDVFRMQIALAHDLKLPLIVHCRNAWEDTFVLLQDFIGLDVILHSFTGDTNIAKIALDRGYLISFSGIVTFPSALDIQEAAKIVPPDKLLVETDSPFLTPVPKRGQRNEPKNVFLSAQFLANLRNVPLEDLASKTEENTKKVFNLALSDLTTL